MTNQREVQRAGYCGVLVASVVLAAGCVHIDQTIYVHGVEAESGMNAPAVFLTDSSEAHRPTLSVRVSRATESQILGSMPINGPRPPDTILTTYRRENLRWSFPPTSVGIDLNMPFSRTFGMEGGVQMSSSHARTIWGGYVGLAVFGGTRNAAVRLSGGVRFSSVSIVAPSVLVQRTAGLFSSPQEEVWFFRDSLDVSPLDWYLTLTVHSSRADWPVNVFLQGAMLRQGLARFSPRVVVYPLLVVNYSLSDARLDYTATMWSLTPGVSVRMSDQIRILAGARLVYHEIEQGRPSSFWIPFLQADIML